jgi:DNA mismatch repair protein MSH4
MYNNKNRFKRTRRPLGAARGLAEKVNDDMGGQTGFALEMNETGDAFSFNHRSADTGLYGQRRNRSFSVQRARTFPGPSGGTAKQFARGATARSLATSTATSRFSRFSKAASQTTTGIRAMMSTTTAAVHIVCAISENLARETCVASMDAGSPTSMHISKQGNAQTYAETIAYLEVLQPDEVLLNEGRRSSQLARKIMELYEISFQSITEVAMGENQPRPRQRRDVQDDEHADPDEDQNQPAVKFLSRALFDQTRGAELLQRIAREESYDATLMEEYILLSSANAVLHYVQQSLGVTYLRNSLHLSINAGGNSRLVIDRSTMLQLELLVNAKTGKARESLIGTMDCTKTAVGSRLLRSNLMSPPARAATINCRLELVDLFLSSQDFFYAVFEHLKNLPDVDKMLSNIALVPRKHQLDRDGKTVMNKKTQERLASKGISALVCIKSTLQALPPFATTLRDLLLDLEGDSPDAVPEAYDDTTIATERSMLMVGLGSGGRDDLDPRKHRLLRSIIVALSQPSLATVLDAVSDVFIENTAFSRKPHTMRHTECFAFKCHGGLLSIVRQTFLANVDEIYKKADEYAEVYSISVNVRYSMGRGHYLAVPIEMELPSIFIQPSKSGRFILCTTKDITDLNNRAQENVFDLLKLTHDRIQEVMEVARLHYDAIASVCDSIALLDMCHSFADNVLTKRYG